MRKSLDSLLNKLEQSAQSSFQKVQNIELVSEDEATAVRGGDKEYKPIYNDETEEYKMGKASILFNLM